MIIDSIQNAQLYLKIHGNFEKSLGFLSKVKFEDFKEEKIIIDDNNLFAIINDYMTKDIGISQLESHKKYIDIQYILEGEELIGYAPMGNQNISVEYDAEKDIIFFSDNPLFYAKLTKGMFAILFPEDLHMPGIKTNNISTSVKKVVMKVLI